MRFPFFTGTLLFFASASAAAAAEPGCVQSACHETLRKGTYLHGPIAGGLCPVCHNVGAEPKKPLPAGHRAVRTEPQGTVCLECHEEIRVLLQQKSVHTPVAEGACITCHDPHGAVNSFLLKIAPATAQGTRRIAPVCESCHAPNDGWFDEFHAGEATLDCVVCHNAHASSEKYQLTGYVRNVFLQATLEEAAERQRRGDLAGLGTSLRKILAMKPEDMDSRIALGRVYFAQERWADAGKEFDLVLARVPDHVDALLGAAKVDAQRSGPYAGLSHLRRAIDVNPSRADIRLEAGRTYSGLGQLQEALAELTRAVEIDPAQAAPHRELAEVHRRLGNADAAAKEMDAYRRLGGK